jgi:hypothetical protein
MSDVSRENFEIVCEAATLMRRVAKPNVSVKTKITLLARKFGWKPGRVTELWYTRARRVDVREMDALRRAAQEQANRYERIARAMEQTDSSFYQQDIVALVHAAHRLRGVREPGTED